MRKKGTPRSTAAPKYKNALILPHPKYGKNPTIPVCFWCGKARNEVKMLGNSYAGEAPMTMVVDYLWCPDCIAKTQGKVTFVECQPNPVGMYKPIARDKSGPIYPTGKWAVAPLEALAGLPAATIATLTKTPHAYVDRATFSAMFGELDAAASVEAVPDSAGGAEPSAQQR